jgi:hypothetical protein
MSQNNKILSLAITFSGVVILGIVVMLGGAVVGTPYIMADATSTPTSTPPTPPPPPPIPPCYDSDGGINYYLFGTTSGAFSGDRFKQVVVPDFCVNSSLLAEYYCSGGFIAYKLKSCQCLNGACKSPAIVK